MEIILANAFSISMLPEGSILRFRREGHPEDLILRNTLVQNAIGHLETDQVVRALLEQGGAIVPVGERVNVTLKTGQALLVAQYRGPRLPEGSTKLPQGATIEWWLVEQITTPGVEEIYSKMENLEKEGVWVPARTNGGLKGLLGELVQRGWTIVPPMA